MSAVGMLSYPVGLTCVSGGIVNGTIYTTGTTYKGVSVTLIIKTKAKLTK